MISVFVGGAIGSCSRYLLGEFIQSNFHDKQRLPISILLINIIGSFLLGLFVTISNEGYFLLVVTGFCGGVTTYSTFSVEAVQLFKKRQYVLFFTYILVTIIGSILGLIIGKMLVSISF